MTMDVQSRPFKDKDLTALVELMAELGYQHSAESLLKNIYAVREQGAEVFVAEVAGEIAGCIATLIDVRLAEGRSGEIVSLVVAQKYRGGGVGKALLATAEQWLIPRVDKINIRANALRAEAHGFYQALGYAVVKQQVVLSKVVK